MQSLEDPHGEFNRSLNVELLQTAVFGAFFGAFQTRREQDGLTHAEIARRTGWSTRGQVSKTLARPQNWTLRTVAELATAFDLELHFVLVDTTDRTRVFTATGTTFDWDRLLQQQSTGARQMTAQGSTLVPVDQGRPRQIDVLSAQLNGQPSEDLQAAGPSVIIGRRKYPR